MPVSPEKSHWRYRALIALVSPIIIAYTLWRSYKDGGGRYLRERLAVYPFRKLPDTPSASIWIHAASVGEVLTVLPLLKAIDAPLLVTTTTPTGAAVLAQHHLSHVTHRYLPVDFSSACDRFFQHANLREGWIVETEIWPSLYARAGHYQVALTIINARMTDRTSQQADGFLADAFRRALDGVCVLSRTKDDAERFIALGASPQRTAVLGNLKYASVSQEAKEKRPLIDVPYVLAASTHDDEELQLAVEWSKRHSKDFGDTVLVVVPRHPERGEKIVAQLSSRNIHAVRRSQKQPVKDAHTVYIADTLGELDQWYAHAIACLVGGSLVERGGHNVLEPARLRCPMVVGPHTSNFDDIVQRLLAIDALAVTHSARGVIDFLGAVTRHPQNYIPAVQRAGEVARQSEGILQDYLIRLRPER